MISPNTPLFIICRFPLNRKPAPESVPGEAVLVRRPTGPKMRCFPYQDSLMRSKVRDGDYHPDLPTDQLAYGVCWLSTSNLLQAFRESGGMRFFRLRQGFKPFGQFRVSLLTCCLGKPRIHLGIFVSLPLDGRLEILLCAADGNVGDGVADFCQKIQMAEGMSCLSFRGIAEQPSDVRIAFDICHPCEIEITPISLRLGCESVLQVPMALRAL